ncbi:MAG: hypothetical protein Q7L19_17125 [Pseudohongiella sp.]|nr:hypothetical protein [Pseudohongiella sp.]
MRVINLLPWREAMYTRQRRHFIGVLTGFVCVALMLASVIHWRDGRNRISYDEALANLQSQLSKLQQDGFLIEQASAELAGLGGKLQSARHDRIQQREWLQLMQEWQLLATEARISAVTWRGDEVVLRGVSEVADPLRKLIYNSPHWQLQQIELNAQSRYQFLVSRSLQIEVSL